MIQKPRYLLLHIKGYSKHMAMNDLVGWFYTDDRPLANYYANKTDWTMRRVFPSDNVARDAAHIWEHLVHYSKFHDPKP